MKNLLIFILLFFCLAFSRNPNWGSNLKGIVSVIPTTEKVLYLTFDACGGGGGYRYDQELVNFLSQEKIEATLFINSRWIEHNRDVFLELSKNPLFSIQNHGTQHKPLSVTPHSIYGIKATGSAEATLNEIMGAHKLIAELTGKAPKYFRSGTAYYDSASINIAHSHGYQIIGFDILGDGGATFSAKKIESQAHRVKPGSIIIYHMNQPKRPILQGIKAAVEYWRKEGYSFKKLP